MGVVARLQDGKLEFVRRVTPTGSCGTRCSVTRTMVAKGPISALRRTGPYRGRSPRSFPRGDVASTWQRSRSRPHSNCDRPRGERPCTSLRRSSASSETAGGSQRLTIIRPTEEVIRSSMAPVHATEGVTVCHHHDPALHRCGLPYGGPQPQLRIYYFTF